MSHYPTPCRSICNYADITLKLRRLRDFHGYSQEAVAYHLKIAQPTYNAIENGKTHITIERLDQMAAFYGLSPTDLMNKSVSELMSLSAENQEINKKGG